MTDQPEKFDLNSHDIAGDKIEELLRLFPEIRTEDGKIDFEQLKRALGEVVDVGKERYGMNWPGKADCFKTIQAPSIGTLRPCPKESVNFDTTENLIVEGDNLEVLKLLQKSYLGKIKMIYIDPPYNTGNDFIYPDNYTESLQTYLEYTGQVDSEGKKFGTNTDTDGRFHSKWLNMTYPRLYLSRNLLREDGVVFISIDDGEVDNLRKLCSEVFGEENFIAQFVWRKRAGGGSDSLYVSTEHEYVLAFAKNIGEVAFGDLPRGAKTLANYRYEDHRFASHGRYCLKPLHNDGLQDSAGLHYDIECPDGTFLRGADHQWVYSESTYLEKKSDDRIVFKPDSTGCCAIYYKVYENEKRGELIYDDGGNVVPPGMKARSIIYDLALNRDGNEDLKVLFGDTKVYDYPKPTKLLKMLTSVGIDETDTVMDFFAGSGTTAQAVLDLNRQDGGNRKFILVQLPEPTGREDYPTIADITKERVRRVIQKLNDEDAGRLDLDGASKQDRGFRVFKLAESNFKSWNAQVPHDEKTLEEQLELHVDHIRNDRSADDILYEILLKSGFPLTTPVETLTLAGKTVYSVQSGAMFICLERELTLELIRAMAEKKPERVVCLDEGFAGNDQLKTNAVQVFKTKGITSFKTV